MSPSDSSARELLTDLDVGFAEALMRLSGDTRPEVWIAAGLLSRQVALGHVCLHLPTFAGHRTYECPELGAWLDALRQSPVVGLCDEDARPLVLDREGRLYLLRHARLERDLATDLRRRAQLRRAVDPSVIARCVSSLCPPETVDDRQRNAVRGAIERQLSVITGGPGTGKTSTVVRMLAGIVEHAFAEGGPAPRIVMTAPTGKAAARLAEAVGRARSTLTCRPEVLACIPDQASTIHRCLGAARGGSRRFRHDRDRPLPADVVVVDEASMVDLSLMGHLVRAVPDRAQLILLGDRHQLASVEAGSVLGDICALTPVARPVASGQLSLDFTPSASPLDGCIVELERSYRYTPDSGVAELAAAIRAGHAERALAALRDPARSDVVLAERGGLGATEFRTSVRAGYGPALRADGPGEKLAALDDYRVLCAHRRGPSGVGEANRVVAELLRPLGLAPRTDGRYAGRPVLIAENDYDLSLFNGDVGLILSSPGGLLSAHFPSADGDVRTISASRLPGHSTAFAISIHKSQGSEFDRVAVVLPSEPSAVLTRELLYTAVTRARTSVLVVGSSEIVRYAIEHRAERASGLADRLHSPYSSELRSEPSAAS